MKLSKSIVWLLSILTIFSFIGCGSNSESVPEMRKVEISVSIPDSLQQKLLEIAQKTDVNITRVTLDVNSSAHIYMQDAPFRKITSRLGDYWLITTDYLPMEEALTFTAKAYNSVGTQIFRGKFNGIVNSQMTSITMPLTTANPSLEETPILRSIVFNNHEQTDITFNVYNPNGDSLNYEITALSSDGGTFTPNQGILNFNSTLKEIAFNTTFTHPSIADSYSYRFTLINSDGESFNTTFNITISPEKTLTVYINMPPIIDAIDLFNEGENLTVNVKAHDSSSSTLNYLWEKIDGSATINSSTNSSTLTLINYQPNSPVTLKITVSDEEGSSVSRIIKSDGATIIRSLELKGIMSKDNKLYAINSDGMVVFLKNEISLHMWYISSLNEYRTETLIKKPLIIDGLAYFIAYNTTTHKRELWKSDGTENGTVMIKDFIFTTVNDSLTNINGIFYFTANDGINGIELWKSNGTTNGTVMVKDILPSGDASPSWLINVNGTLYFNATDGTHGYELWKSDGTDNGTVMVKDINLNELHGFASNLMNINNILYFTVDDGTHGKELWRSDGTENGTVMVKDINPTGDSSPSNLTNINGTLYFNAYDPVHRGELWKSDGTTDGTVMIKDINTNNNYSYYIFGGSRPREFQNINNTIYFGAAMTIEDGYQYWQLWESNGTTNDTLMVKNINGYSHIINIDNTLYFAVEGINNNRDELWKSDGTADGTVMVKDINPTGSSSLSYLTNINGTLYLLANEGELWKSDGTETGTVKITLPE